jgi:hypothetical protein
VFENRVLRRIFGPTRDEVTVDWTKLHNEELHNLYTWPSIIRMTESRRMRWAEHVARMGEKRSACKLLVGKPEGNSSLGRPRCRWVDNFKMDLREIKWGGIDWIVLAQDRNQRGVLVNTVMNLQVGRFSRRAQLHGVSCSFKCRERQVLTRTVGRDTTLASAEYSNDCSPLVTHAPIMMS